MAAILADEQHAFGKTQTPATIKLLLPPRRAGGLPLNWQGEAIIVLAASFAIVNISHHVTVPCRLFNCS